MYVFVLAIFLTGFALIWRIVHSPFGQILKAIRENQDRAISLGYDTDLYKLIAFVISGALAGTACASSFFILMNALLPNFSPLLSATDRAASSPATRAPG